MHLVVVHLLTTAAEFYNFFTRATTISQVDPAEFLQGKPLSPMFYTQILSTMVTIVDYKQRVNAAGDPFFALIVQGGIELIQSGNTGQFYANAKNASIISTFNEATCQKLIGQELPGTVERVACPEYE